MKNFIFKSHEDFHKMIFNKLENIQTELRHQRQDHVILQGDIEKIRLDLNLKMQADSYYEDHELTHTTHPRTKQTSLEDSTLDGNSPDNR